MSKENIKALIPVPPLQVINVDWHSEALVLRRRTISCHIMCTKSITYGVVIVSSLAMQLLSPASEIVKGAEEAVAPVLSRRTSMILVPVSSIRHNI
jgi:hypothetical protein